MAKMVEIFRQSQGDGRTIIACPGLPVDQIEVIQKTLEVVNEKSYYPEKWKALVVNYQDPPPKE